ncbi:hypothetical protein, partial [Amycolatopsis pretoriensis]|uniref:hypothetical protein n=1 Tax=Amycolatopsis pretoriensis TaxID=218821 RepID=UPI001B80D0F3
EPKPGRLGAWRAGADEVRLIDDPGSPRGGCPAKPVPRAAVARRADLPRGSCPAEPVHARRPRAKPCPRAAAAWPSRPPAAAAQLSWFRV